MSHGYRVIQWTPFKKAYDRVLALGAGVFIATYAGVSIATQSPGESFTPIQLGIRALGAAAFTLLTLILSIGPLARLSSRFTPLLYNRRHLGVTCFALAASHAALVVLWYHGFSTVNPLVSLLVSNPRYGALQGFPFESLGLIALFALFTLAATSHDFWNANLGPVVWKAIHMSVYAAYALIVAHIMLGAVQSARIDLYAWIVGAAAMWVAGLHLLTGLRESARDRAKELESDGWIKVCLAFEIPDRCARVVTPRHGERIAVFRHGERIFALSNVCRHQGGPLGEGRIIDGCVVCPWHGFQYQPEDGRSPPPFSEKVSTYRTRVENGMVFVHPAPSAPGAATAPSYIAAGPVHG